MPSHRPFVCIPVAFLLVISSLAVEVIPREDKQTDVTGLPAERIHFADDYYLVSGLPLLSAAPTTPVFRPGENATLRIALANGGRVEQLIPKNIRSGEEELAAEEMREEERSTDALINGASLSSNGPIRVVGGPFTEEEMPFLLPSGSVIPLEFNISIDETAEGAYDLLLRLTYDYQIDASVTNDSVIPLVMPMEFTQKISIVVEGAHVSFSVASIESDLSPGDSGSLILAIRNDGKSAANGCNIQLMAAPPFQMLTDRFMLGDVGPGDVAVARFELAVDEAAHSQEYQLASEITYMSGTDSLSIPVVVKSGRNLLYWIVPALLILISAGAYAYISRGKVRRAKGWKVGGRKTRRAGSLRRRSIWDRLLKR